MNLLCSLPLLAGLLSQCGAQPPFAVGYVEGEYTLIAPVEIAQVATVHVRRGDRLVAGAILAEMERQSVEIALSEAQANVAQAKSRLADLLEGARPEEIEVIEANLASARLQADEAERVLARTAELSARGVVTDAQLDDAETAAEVSKARVAQITAELAVARLPARSQAIASARATVAAAEAARDRVNWRLENTSLSLAEPVTVIDIIRHQGEIAGPSAPVMSVLPDGAVKLRLYIPESNFRSIAVGDVLRVECSGCADDLTARVSYISDEPEFTPPVIYSLDSRQKLVYLVEARPDGSHALKPGQIVDVALPKATK